MTASDLYSPKGYCWYLWNTKSFPRSRCQQPQQSVRKDVHNCKFCCRTCCNPSHTQRTVFLYSQVLYAHHDTSLIDSNRYGSPFSLIYLRLAPGTVTPHPSRRPLDGPVAHFKRVRIVQFSILQYPAHCLLTLL